MTRYTIQMDSQGSGAVAYTRVRSDVRGWVLDFAWKFASRPGVMLTVRAGDKVLSRYEVRNGRWTRTEGTEVRGLEGLDSAGCYRAMYGHLSHVTPEYVAQMAR